MNKRDSRVDAYIVQSAAFAQPILTHLRELVHMACPDVTETIKWGFPNFDYEGIICNMAAFRQHCAFNFWKASLLPDPHGILKKGEEKDSMGNLGQIRELKDLPSDRIMTAYIKEAAKLNKEGVKRPASPAKAVKGRQPPAVPGYFSDALGKNKKALKAFEAFSPSYKKEYIEWITEAKTEKTRNRRISTAVEWIAEGKSRNWKYMKK